MPSVIFDLDGTLIDSAESILASIQAAFDEAGIVPALALTNDLIGPSLLKIVSNLLTEAHIGALPKLIEGFKSHYDETGYRDTKVFEGISGMLGELKNMHFSLYIATNKRINPARKIIQHLGWTKLFSEIYTLDHFNPAVYNKATMLRRLNLQVPNTSNESVYIGDRAEDAEAAEEAGIPFLFAGWGYGNTEKICCNVARLHNPAMLVKYMQG
jgi:phosphoglycolate phosphatase